VTACQQCGAENSDPAKFCSECGAPLPGAVAEHRERRVVSTLFADLAAFTRRSESMDVEDVEGFLDPYFAVLREEVERTGGLIAKFTGDGVMALFGALIAHEDDPERAVRCGLSICERVGDLAGELHVRVGITTGEAMVTLPADGHPDAIGDVINTAARLEAAAPHDGVLVDAWTYRATSRAIDYGDQDSIAAKGKAEPVEAWVALAPRSIVPEQQRDQRPIIGREVETGVLLDAFERSRREPSTQLVSIIGEPGIGKTRLVEELYAYISDLPELIVWRRGRSLAYGDGIAFWALGEMVKAEAGILESDSAAVAAQRLREAVEALDLEERDRAWVARHLGPLVGLEAAASGADGSRVEAFAAWRRFFEALAETGPTVLVFEDIHWADEALLDFIELLTERAGAVPMFIVCTARPELLERRAGWAGGTTNPNTISLAPLTNEDTARLVGGLLDQALLPDSVQQPLLTQASGNPLYAQEYVRMLQDRCVLVHRDGGWTLDGEVTGLPESIQGIIAARLDALSPEEKSLLQDAAVIGRTAWIGAVCALTERNPWEAEELVHGLDRKRLVQRSRRSSIQGEIEFVFGHALTRDVAYSQIRRAHRAEKHEAAADWIEQLAGEREDKAELLADHYTQALTLRQALGEDTTMLARRARAAFTEAARQAAAVNAASAAARHYRAALDLVAADDPERPALLLGEALARYANEDVDTAFFGEAAAAQVAAMDWEAATRIEMHLANWFSTNGGDGVRADVHLANAEDYAARVGPSEITCRIVAYRAFRLYLTGQAEDAFALTNDLIPVVDKAGLELGLARLLEVRSMARVDLGDTDGGIGDIYQAAEIFAAKADPYTALVYSNLAELELSLGNFPAVDEALAVTAELATRYALPFYLEVSACAGAYNAYHHADWPTAVRLVADIQTTSQFTDANIRIVRGRISLARRDTEAALEDAEAITRFATATQDDEMLFEGLALHSRIHAARGDLEAARVSGDRYLRRWHDRDGLLNRAITLCELAPVLAVTDGDSDIRQAAVLLPNECQWRDALLLTADQRYAEAADVYEQLGSQPLAADAYLLAAQAAAADGRASDAARYAQAVQAFATKTGATLYQQFAADLLTTPDATSA
jgi:class 3 adenylate cyclase